MIVYPQLMVPVPAHSLLGVSVVCFDASDWGQSPAPALRALSEQSRSQLRGRSQSPSHQSVSSGQWRGRCDIMCDASHVWHDICLVVKRSSIGHCNIPLIEGCHYYLTHDDISEPFAALIVNFLQTQTLIPKGSVFRVERIGWRQKVCSHLECESELEILDLAPEIGFLRFMVSV